MRPDVPSCIPVLYYFIEFLPFLIIKLFLTYNIILVSGVQHSDSIFLSLSNNHHSKSSYHLSPHKIANIIDFIPYAVHCILVTFILWLEVCASISFAYFLPSPEPLLSAAAKSLQSCPTLRPHRRQPTRLPLLSGNHQLFLCMRLFLFCWNVHFNFFPLKCSFLISSFPYSTYAHQSVRINGTG